MEALKSIFKTEEENSNNSEDSTSSTDLENSTNSDLSQVIKLSKGDQIKMAQMSLNDFKARVKDFKVTIIQQLNVPVLKHNNWHDWQYCIKSKLRLADLWFMLETNFADDVLVSPEFIKVDNFVYDLIVLNVSEQIRADLYTTKTTKEVWNVLINKFEGNQHMQCMRVFNSLLKVVQNKSNNLNNLANVFRNFLFDISKLFPGIDKNAFIGLLFASLPDNYSYLPSVFRSREDLKIEEVIDCLIQEQQMFSERLSSTNNSKHHKNVLPNYGVQVSDGNLNDRVHSKANDKSKGKQNKSRFKDKKCSYCDKNGHTIKSCYKLKKLISEDEVKVNSLTENNSNEETHKVNSATVYGFSNYICSKADQHSHQIEREAWYIDTGAARHLTNNLNGCVWLNPTNDIIVRDAHGHTKKAIGVGEFKLFSSTTNEFFKLENVIYDDSLDASYLSGGQLMENGCSFMARGNSIEISDEQNKLVLTGTKLKNNLFKLNVQNQRMETVLSGVSISEVDRIKVQRWHEVMGHMNFIKLDKFFKIYNIKLRSDSTLKCKTCMLSKSRCLPFQLSKSTSTDVLQLIHSDVSGIVRIKNYFNVKYYVTFLDDHSRMSFVYLMKSKDEVFEKFVSFKNMIELKTNKKIKILRSDQGTEYVNQKFQELSDKTGIQLQNSIPRRQQQNGASEKLNKDLNMIARSLLIAANLNPTFWPFAVTTASYLRNRAPCQRIDFDIPFKKFFGRLPELDLLQKFGEDCVIKNDNPQNKYSPNGLRGIFLGYARNVKGYLIYLCDEKKVIESRDVKFAGPSVLQRDSEFEWDGQVEHFADVLVYETPDFDDTGDFSHFVRDCDDGLITINETNETVDFNSFVNHEQGQRILNIVDVRPTVSENRIQFNQDTIHDNADDNHEEIVTSENTNQFQIQHPIENVDTSGKSTLSESRSKSGDVLNLNKSQKAEFLNNNPGLSLKFVRRLPKTKPNEKVQQFIVNAVSVPKTFKQAIQSVDRSHWCKAMMREINSLNENKTWTVVDRTENMKVLPGFWIYKIKYHPDLTIDTYKSRYVVCGNKLPDIFEETYSPVLRASSINILFSLAQQYSLKLEHIDIKTAYLHGKLDGDYYVTQPPGFESADKPFGVCKLHKALYGLPVSGRKFNEFISNLLKIFKLRKLLSDQCIFVDEHFKLIVGVYVDDLIILYKGIDILNAFKKWLKKQVDITEKGELTHCLSLNVRCVGDKLFVNQHTYIKEFLEKYKFTNLKPISTPMLLDIDLSKEDKDFEDRTWFRSVLGASLYLADKTRPDICFAVGQLCRFMQQPKHVHVAALRRIIRYLIGTIDHALVFKRGKADLICYADADFGNDISSGKSTSGILVYLFGNLVYWSSKKQNYVALSTCESEILSIREGVSMMVYVRNLLYELNILSHLVRVPVLYNDNTSAIATLVDGGSFNRNKHYLMRINFIRDHIHKTDLQVTYKESKLMLADYLTKPLAYTLFQRLVTQSGICINPLD